MVAESKPDITDETKHITNLSIVQLAMRPSVRNRAVAVGLVVGTLLALINHLDAVIDGSFAISNALQVLTTYLVPYGVSTYSSVGALRAPPGPSQ